MLGTNPDGYESLRHGRPSTRNGRLKVTSAFVLKGISAPLWIVGDIGFDLKTILFDRRNNSTKPWEAAVNLAIAVPLMAAGYLAGEQLPRIHDAAVDAGSSMPLWLMALAILLVTMTVGLHMARFIWTTSWRSEQIPVRLRFYSAFGFLSGLMTAVAIYALSGVLPVEIVRTVVGGMLLLTILFDLLAPFWHAGYRAKLREERELREIRRSR
jgi:hypothetical protein